MIIKFDIGVEKVLVICNNRDVFPSKRDQNGGIAAISCHTVASRAGVAGGRPLPLGGVRAGPP